MMERAVYLLIVAIVIIVLVVFLFRLVGGGDGDIDGAREVLRGLRAVSHPQRSGW